MIMITKSILGFKTETYQHQLVLNDVTVRIDSISGNISVKSIFYLSPS